MNSMAGILFVVAGTVLVMAPWLKTLPDLSDLAERFPIPMRKLFPVADDNEGFEDLLSKIDEVVR